MATLATISGVALEPCVSSNGRLYTPEHIRGAFARLSDRLKTGRQIPVSFTSHADREHGDIRRIAGALRSVSLTPEAKLRFDLDVVDTDAGKDVVKLTAGQHPAVNAVSIVGQWLGEVHHPEVDGRKVETGDGLDIQGFDIVDSPGVDGARIDRVQLHGSAGERVGERHLIYESAGEVAVTQVTEAAEANKQPYGAVTYADPGYQADKVKRYPLDTKAHVKAAWSYINIPKNAAKYSSDQVARIKGKIKSAAKKMGVTISSESAPVVADLFEGDAFARHATEPYSPLIPIDPDQDGDTDFLACPTCGTVRPVTDPDLNPDVDDDNDMRAGFESAPTAPEETHVTETAATLTPEEREAADAAVTALREKKAKEAAAPAAAPTALTESTVAELIDKKLGEGLEKLKGELIDAVRGNGGVPRTGVVPGAVKPTGEAAPPVDQDTRLRELAGMSAQQLREAGAKAIAPLVHTPDGREYPARWRVVPPAG